MLRDALVEEIVFSPVSIVTRGALRSWRAIPLLFGIPLNAWRLRGFIHSHRIDLVHTNVGIILSSALGARWAGIPHIWHIRDWYGEFRWLWKWYRWFILRFSQVVICVSRAIADQFPASEKVVVVHDGFPSHEFAVDRPRLRSDFRKKYEISADAPVVGCIGRIKFVRKGQEFLVRAAALLRDRGHPVVTLIVGNPAPGSEDHLLRLQNLARELQIFDQVIFTGELSDTREAYAALDIFTLTSGQPEPFGGVVMEAMYMSLPVIATALGGSLDQVVDGETGFLIEPRNPEALAEKIARLLDDPGLRKQMGRAGRMRMETAFTLEGMTSKIEDLYRTVLTS